MSNKKGLLVIVFIAVFMSLASASVQLGKPNASIETSYGTEENIRGWINISFLDEKGDSLISAEGFSGSKKLINFLDENLADYTCKPEDCENEYKAIDGTTTKSFSFSGSKILALVLEGSIDAVTGLSFDVSANNAASCSQPLKIDILNDKNTEWKSEKLTDLLDCGSIGNGELGKGCYKEENVTEVRIGNTYYCEKISLLRGKKFKIGAWIKGDARTTFQQGLLAMEVWSLDGDKINGCNLQEPSLNGGEISCNIDLTEEIEGEHYVCLKSNQDTYYKIKRESKNVCGFYGTPETPSNYNYDYSIFAKSAKFDNIGTFTFNQEEYEKQNEGDLAEYINGYIDNKYEKNCSNKCIIPINFTASNLAVTISNIKLSYQKEGSPDEENKIYNTEEGAARISSSFQVLDLSLSGIKTPKTYGNHTLRLKLENENLLTAKINVVKVPIIQAVFPNVVPVNMLNKFFVLVSSPTGKNITSYIWNFGDESEEEETTKPSIIHAYPAKGEYDLKISVEDASGLKSEKNFKIEVGSAKDAVNSTIKNYRARLSNITNQLALMPSWYKDEAGKAVGFDELKNSVDNLEKKYNSATDDDEYTEIMGNLSGLEVPRLIKTSVEGSTPFFVNADDVNLGNLEEFGAGSVKDEEAYKRAIAAWTQANLNLELKFKYVTAYYDERSEILFSVFDLSIKPAEDLDKEFYVVINSNPVLDSKDYETKDFEDAVGIRFSDIKTRDIAFAISADVSLEDLIVYVSPEFSLLQVEEEISPCNYNGKCEKDENENSENCRADCKPWGTAIILLIILFFFAIIAYIALQWWYKEKYEQHLFKNRNDLFNIINFIKNAKSQGIKDSEIANKLKQAGWGGEQINYAFKKIEGKAIMPLDFLKLFKKFERAKLKTTLPGGKPLVSVQKNF